MTDANDAARRVRAYLAGEPDDPAWDIDDGSPEDVTPAAVTLPAGAWEELVAVALEEHRHALTGPTAVEVASVERMRRAARPGSTWHDAPLVAGGQGRPLEEAVASARMVARVAVLMLVVLAYVAGCVTGASS